MLYVTFLGNLYQTSFEAGLPMDYIDIPDEVIDGLVGGQLFSSLLSVCCITIAFCSNMLMVQDRANGSIKDLYVSPVNKTSLAFSSKSDEYDYLKRFYYAITNEQPKDVIKLNNQGFTMRDIEILSGVSKSQAYREVNKKDE